MSGLYQATTNQIVVFTLDEQSFALSLPAVKKVIHAIEIRQLPKAPEIIIGIINVNGRIIPVADIRKRFGLPAREIDLEDRLIITDTGKREVAILVNSLTGIRDLDPAQILSAEDIPFAGHISGVAKCDDGMVLIYNLEQFLSLDEAQGLDSAMKKRKK